MAKRCSFGCSGSPWDDSEREQGSGGARSVVVVEEIDGMVVLPEIGDAGDAGEADRTEVL